MASPSAYTQLSCMGAPSGGGLSAVDATNNGGANTLSWYSRNYTFGGSSGTPNGGNATMNSTKMFPASLAAVALVAQLAAVMEERVAFALVVQEVGPPKTAKQPEMVRQADKDFSLS